MVKQCWNGPQCKFLAKGTCFYYHPLHYSDNQYQNISNNNYHQNIYKFQNQSTFYHSQYQYSNMFIYNPQTYQNNFQMRCPFYKVQNNNFVQNQNVSVINRQNDYYKEFLQIDTYSQNLVSPYQQVNSSNQMLNISYESQNLSYVNASFLSQQESQNASESWGSQNFKDSLNIQKYLDKKWFFQKNKHLQAINLTQQFLQKCSECAICYDYFQKQKSPQEKDVSDQKSQKISNIQKQQQNLITELFCKHAFHKSCIKKWLMQNSLCPLCKQDFRLHEEYKTWDQNYKQKIKNYDSFDDDSEVQSEDDMMSLGEYLSQYQSYHFDVQALQDGFYQEF